MALHNFLSVVVLNISKAKLVPWHYHRANVYRFCWVVIPYTKYLDRTPTGLKAYIRPQNRKLHGKMDSSLYLCRNYLNLCWCCSVWWVRSKQGWSIAAVFGPVMPIAYRSVSTKSDYVASCLINYSPTCISYPTEEILKPSLLLWQMFTQVTFHSSIGTKLLSSNVCNINGINLSPFPSDMTFRCGVTIVPLNQLRLYSELRLEKHHSLQVPLIWSKFHSDIFFITSKEQTPERMLP